MLLGNMNDNNNTAIGFDVVVIGGGAAGLSGALLLARSRRSVLVIGSGEPRNAPAAAVHNFLTRDGNNPLQLLELGRAEVRGYGGQIERARVRSACSQAVRRPSTRRCCFDKYPRTWCCSNTPRRN